MSPYLTMNSDNVLLILVYHTLELDEETIWPIQD